MDLILASTNTMELDTFLWFIGIVLGIIGTLIGVICWFYYHMIQKIEEKLSTLEDKFNTETVKSDAKYETLTHKIEAEAKERADKHDAFGTRVFSEIDKVKEKTGDLGETIAGFGSIYLTRNEFTSAHRRGTDK